MPRVAQAQQRSGPKDEHRLSPRARNERIQGAFHAGAEVMVNEVLVGSERMAIGAKARRPARPADTREVVMPRPKTSISERLNWASVALANALGDGELVPLLAAYGFDQARLLRGRGLMEAASGAVTRQVGATGDLRAATARAEAAQRAAFDAYQALAQVARAAFKRDKATLTALGLDRAMPRRTSLFITMALALFDNAAGAPATAAALAEFGYTAERLAAERNTVLAFIEAVRAQEAAKGTAQSATAQQGAAMAALDDEMGAFRRVARVALRHQPQLLEKLGIVKRSAPASGRRVKKQVKEEELVGVK